MLKLLMTIYKVGITVITPFVIIYIQNMLMMPHSQGHLNICQVFTRHMPGDSEQIVCFWVSIASPANKGTELGAKALCNSKKILQLSPENAVEGHADASHSTSWPGFGLPMPTQFQETLDCPGTTLYLSSPQNLEPVKPSQVPPIPPLPVLSAFSTCLAPASGEGFSGSSPC